MNDLRVAYRRRAALAFLLTAALAGYFWSQSRVPALQQKAAMGGRTRMGHLGFEVLFPTGIESSFPERVWQTSLEWGVTNWRGMTFGVLFAACIMTLVSCFPRRREAGVGGALKGVLQGLATGVPLGLCANCATPVAHGMYRSGLRAEASLAALLSSPTLNPIVLGMLFSMFPLGVAVLKVGLTLLLVVVLMPLLLRLLPVPPEAPPVPEGDGGFGFVTRLTRVFFRPPPVVECPLAGAPPEPWGRALGQTFKLLFGNLLYVLLATVPLMALGGVLGAALVEVTPLDALTEAGAAPMVLVGAALLGTFLPVPMSFDVLMAAMLFAAGAPLSLAATMLFTLGVFSVYPFMVMWRNLRPALAVALFGVVAALGLGFGYAADALQSHATRAAIDFYSEHGTHRTGRDLMEYFSQQCGTLHDDTTACLEAATRRALADGEDASICRVLPQPRQPECDQAARFEALTRAAIRDGHLKRCDEHGEEKDRNQCKQLVVDAVTRDNPDVSICDELADKGEAGNCKMHALRAWIEPRGDATLCSALGDATREPPCREFAETAAAALRRSPEACQAFQNPERAQFCLDTVATLLVDTAIADRTSWKGCESVPEDLQKACRNRWVTKWSRALGEPDRCQFLEDETNRKSCAQAAVVESILAHVRQLRAEATGSMFVGGVGDALAPGGTPAAAPSLAPPSAPERIRQGPPEVRRVAFTPRDTTGDAKFVRYEGPSRGLTGLPRFTGLDFREPFVTGRGVASGDFDEDGRPDLAFAARGGPRLFRNLGGLHFAPVALPATVQDADVLAVALVDVDSDGHLDLFFSAYGGDVRALLNDGGHFDGGRFVRFPNRDAMVALAPAFGDTNRDGRLDAYLGNWSFGSEKGFEPTLSRNHMLVSVAQGYVEQFLPEAPGETLTALFSDLNGDRTLDLLVGNDYDRPDHLYFGAGDGRFGLVGRKTGVFPGTPMHTMSIDSGDIDNDLDTDVLMVDMSFSPATPGIYCDTLTGEAAARCKVSVAAFDAFEGVKMGDCLKLPAPADEVDTQACLAATLTQLALTSREPKLCDQLPPDARSLHHFCEKVLSTPNAPPLPVGDWMDQGTANKLLVSDGQGHFTDAAARVGVQKSGWTWNARFLDLDDDGYQDIYVGNGYKFQRPTPNVFYRNAERGNRFVESAAQAGLDERLDTPAFTAVDLDGDGDSDLVLTTVGGPPMVYENRLSRGNAVEIELRDAAGNPFGVGSRIVIEVADAEATHQMREIRASGGYLSFDAPVAHFGLGAATTLGAIEVQWSTGQPQRIVGPFEAGYRYVLLRGPADSGP